MLRKVQKRGVQVGYGAEGAGGRIARIGSVCILDNVYLDKVVVAVVVAVVAVVVEVEK